MAKVQIINNLSDLCKLKETEHESYAGYVYAIEYNNGKTKIGQTSSPYSRITTQIGQMASYAGINALRIALSPVHTNYRENEKVLHLIFDNVRDNCTEMFCIKLEDAVEAMENKLNYLDEREKKRKEARVFTESLKKAIMPNKEKLENVSLPELLYSTESTRYISGEALQKHIINLGSEFDKFSEEREFYASILSKIDAEKKYIQTISIEYFDYEENLRELLSNN